LDQTRWYLFIRPLTGNGLNFTYTSEEIFEYVKGLSVINLGGFRYPFSVSRFGYVTGREGVLLVHNFFVVRNENNIFVNCREIKRDTSTISYPLQKRIRDKFGYLSCKPIVLESENL
jgi:hypothetical protein